MTPIPLDPAALEKAAKKSKLHLMNVTEAVSAYLDALVESGRASETNGPVYNIYHFPLLIIHLKGGK
jgi:hypothetical protein